MAEIFKTRSVMTMTKAEALRIQAEQIDHYAKFYGDGIRAIIAAATTADQLPDGEHPVTLINRHIPRGGRLEQLIPQKVAQEAEAKARCT